MKLESWSKIYKFNFLNVGTTFIQLYENIIWFYVRMHNTKLWKNFKYFGNFSNKCHENFVVSSKSFVKSLVRNIIYSFSFVKFSFDLS